ncbi:MAG: flagellar protein [Lachnospiraceae bacterium]|nr:flagellar protein [Lachnospiraceae bacterium]
MKVQNSQYLSALQMQEQLLNQKNAAAVRTQTPQGSLSFRDILSQKTEEGFGELRFSKHAMGRLADRNIRLTDEQMERLSDGTQKAGAKGIKESLVIVDQLAFIVNIPNQTVVTAMDQTETEANIFTNIDGAVIM